MNINPTLFWLLIISYGAIAIISLFSHILPLWIAIPCLIATVTVLAFFTSRRIRSPLAKLEHIAQNIANGQFDNQFPWSESNEISNLATAISDMSTLLQDRINIITNERNEKGIILKHLTDGIIIIDTQERILSINDTATKLINYDNTKTNQHLTQLIRNTELGTYITATMSDTATTDTQSVLIELNQKTILFQCIPIQTHMEKSSKALVILHDLTPIKQLDALRKDFVANVSHELKTPITLIKGALETLEEPNLPAEKHLQFLQMAKTHADRLDHILEDLLTLARLEQSQLDITTELAPLTDTIQSALTLCEPLIQEKNIQVIINCDPSIVACHNHDLIEQALINLIKNAIQYSQTPTLTITTTRTDTHTVIQVKDEGTGIPAQHLARLFERFYRVDPGRTRKEGGTGLGLSLVKHIMHAHHGYATVTSEEGKGSQFELYFPHLSQQKKET
jgi:two-component system, OmpR family, phosphate regulon sensor histidine kinase PhoR